MKLTSIIALFFISFLANPAHAYQNPRWSKLDAKTLGNLVRDAKEILREGESHQLFSQLKTPGYFTLIFDNAFATETAYDCFYGGWPSQLKTFGAKRLCTNPKNQPDYPASQCKEGELACNPILFGPDHCVSNITAHEKSTSFSNCEAQFKQGDGNYDFLKDLTADQAQVLDETLSAVRDVCEKGSIGTQKSTQMCASFLRKVDRLTESQAYRDHATQIKNDQVTAGTQSGSETQIEPSPSVAASASATPASTPATSPIEKKDNDCCTTPNSPKTEVKGISDITQAIEKNNNPTVQQLYDSLKKQYESSPVCRIQSRMNTEEKMMNALAHYAPGLTDIVMVGPSESKAGFIDHTVSELGLDPSLSAQYEKIRVADDATRRAFKYDLTQKIIAKLKSDPNALDTAIEASFTDRKMANCTFVSFDAFSKAMKGREKLKGKLAASKSGLLTIVDYTLPYSARRLFVMDVEKQQTLQNTWVALGGGDGKAITNPDGSNPKTSNEGGSMMSSEGFAITGEQYNGTWGRSMRIDGQDANNTSMRSRAVVLHPWPEQDYTPYNQYKAFYPDLPKRMNKLINQQVSTDPKNLGEIDSILLGIKTQMQTVRIPYTDGCLGVPPSDVAQVRDAITGKSLMYLYTGENQKSRYL